MNNPILSGKVRPLSFTYSIIWDYCARAPCVGPTILAITLAEPDLLDFLVHECGAPRTFPEPRYTSAKN